MSTISGYHCAVRTCPVVVRGPELSIIGGQEFYESLLMGWGWTFWIGRSRVGYCPDHKPGKVHKMRQVLPEDLYQRSRPRPAIDMLPNAWLLYPEAPKLHTWDLRNMTPQQQTEATAVFDQICGLLGLPTGPGSPAW